LLRLAKGIRLLLLLLRLGLVAACGFTASEFFNISHCGTFLTSAEHITDRHAKRASSKAGFLQERAHLTPTGLLVTVHVSVLDASCIKISLDFLTPPAAFLSVHCDVACISLRLLLLLLRLGLVLVLVLPGGAAALVGVLSSVVETTHNFVLLVHVSS